MATATFSGQYGHNMTLEVWSVGIGRIQLIIGLQLTSKHDFEPMAMRACGE